MQVQERTYNQAAPVPVPPAIPPLAGQVMTPPPDRPPEQHSRLGQITISLGLLSVGALGMVDLAGADMPGSAYLAVPLTVVGLGLLAGAWFGRARWLIGIGVVLSVLLGIGSAVESIDAANGSVTWRPTTIEQLDSSYQIDMGTAVLDLSTLDFTGQNLAVQVTVGAGNLTVIVPPNVDVRAEATVDVGNANVFGQRWNGIGQDEHTVTDNGADGTGGGSLVIRAAVDVGNLEVRR